MRREQFDLSRGKKTTPAVKHVPSSVVIGRYGHCASRGYTEVNGIRFYEDMVVVGNQGQHSIDPGFVEPAPWQPDHFRQLQRKFRNAF